MAVQVQVDPTVIFPQVDKKPSHWRVRAIPPNFNYVYPRYLKSSSSSFSSPSTASRSFTEKCRCLAIFITPKFFASKWLIKYLFFYLQKNHGNKFDLYFFKNSLLQQLSAAAALHQAPPSSGPTYLPLVGVSSPMSTEQSHTTLLDKTDLLSPFTKDCKESPRPKELCSNVVSSTMKDEESKEDLVVPKVKNRIIISPFIISIFIFKKLVCFRRIPWISQVPFIPSRCFLPDQQSKWFHAFHPGLARVLQWKYFNSM